MRAETEALFSFIQNKQHHVYRHRVDWDLATEYASRGLPDDKRGVFYEALELICENLQMLSKEGLPEK